ncbi:MAG: preprotein translocase subunit YajC [Verrucomicrobiales bacterium]|nr:preprotein translocase subunit YajC [Verrucomicrobiales bacterium]
MTIAFVASALMGFAPPTAPGTQSTAPAWVQLVPFFLIFVVMYLVMIRPQQKKAKEHAALLKSLKAGDKVVASSGIVGVVVGIRDQYVTIRSEDSKLEVLKSSIQDVTERKA